MDSSTVYIISAAISLFILYFIVTNAVRSGNKEVLKQMRLQNKLKIEELKTKGFSVENLNEIVDMMTK